LDSEINVLLKANKIEMTSARSNQITSVSALPWRLLKAGNKTGESRKYSPDAQLASQHYTAETLHKYFAKDGDPDFPDTKYVFIGTLFFRFIDVG
jgi:hypothetical protein